MENIICTMIRDESTIVGIVPMVFGSTMTEEIAERTSVRQIQNAQAYTTNYDSLKSQERLQSLPEVIRE
ncbi:hypothetical protein KQX54_003982 [Cotesia glomerata]|uniref:Uncharacterized protein n=1 Tax=Cotesia glomerata TaxID=32391 RepID=A0AAV7HNY4_COTGL|nr:hypothetical protein KQX54_003982 [Cotesia glomerata]